MAPWLPEHDAIIRKYHPDYQTIRRLLPARSFEAIKQRAHKIGCTKPHKAWTMASRRRLLKLRENHTVAEIAALMPDRSYRAIKELLRELGGRRLTASVQSQSPLAQELRQRCRDEGLRLADLYRFLGTSPFLNEVEVRRVGPSSQAFMKATEALGGELYVEWED